MGYAFISYSSKNLDAADAMRRILHNSGVPTWMAPYDIPAGSEYAEVLYDALTGCACLVLMLTGDSQNSLWVKKEVNIAISNCKTVIPVKLEDLELNSAMKLYLNDQQIVPVHTLDENSPEVRKVLASVLAATGEGSVRHTEEQAMVARPAPVQPAVSRPAPVQPVVTQGRQVLSDGVYEGDLVNGQRTGKGVYKWNNGDCYEGEFRNGVRHGKGKYIWAKGTVYEGDFLNGQRTGKGKLTRPAGDIYEGDFVNGKQTGKGKYICPFRTPYVQPYVYEGDFIDNKRTGKAKITYDNGNVFEGDVVDGQCHGNGVLSWNAGTVKDYSGYYLSPQQNPPRLLWENGYRFVGTYEKDVRTNGKIYDKDGRLRIILINGIAHFQD